MHMRTLHLPKSKVLKTIHDMYSRGWADTGICGTGKTDKTEETAMQCPCGGETRSVTLVRTSLRQKLEFDMCKACGRQGNYLLWVDGEVKAREQEARLAFGETT
jgi:hypothetical protein